MRYYAYIKGLKRAKINHERLSIYQLLLVSNTNKALFQVFTLDIEHEKYETQMTLIYGDNFNCLLFTNICSDHRYETEIVDFRHSEINECK